MLSSPSSGSYQNVCNTGVVVYDTPLVYIVETQREEGKLSKATQALSCEIIKENGKTLSREALEAVATKSAKKKKKKKKKIPQKLIPWIITDPKFLSFLGPLNIAKNDALPSWMQKIVGESVAIDLSTRDYIFAELTSLTLEALHFVKSQPLKKGTTHEFLKTLPHELSFYSMLFDLYFRKNMDYNTPLFSDEFTDPISQNIEGAISGLTLIYDTIAVHVDALQNLTTHPLIVKLEESQRIQAIERLKKISEIIGNLVELYHSGKERFLFLGLHTSHLIRREEKEIDLQETLSEIAQRYRRALLLVEYLQKDLKNYYSAFNYSFVRKELFSYICEVEKLRDESLFTSKETLKLKKMQINKEYGIRTAMIQSIAVTDRFYCSRQLPPVADCRKINLALFKNITNIDEMGKELKKYWYVRIFTDIRQQLEIIRFTFIKLHYGALRREGLRLEKSCLEKYRSTFHELLIELDKIERTEELSEKIFVTAKGVLSFNQFIEMTHDDEGILRQLNSDTPYAWCRLSPIIDDIKERLENFFPKVLEKKASQLKFIIEQLPRTSKEKRDRKIAAIFQAIESITAFISLFDSYGSRLSHLYENLSTIPLPEKREEDRGASEETEDLERRTSVDNGADEAKQQGVDSEKEEESPPPAQEESRLSEATAQIYTPSVAEDEEVGSLSTQESFEEEKKSFIESASKIISTTVDKILQKINDNEKKSHRSLKNVTYKELASELMAAGWRLIKGTKGGHAQFKHPDHPELGRFPLPRHSERKALSTGVVAEGRKRIEQAIKV